MPYLRRVLIIDDDRDDRNAIESILGPKYDCDQAPGGERAFQLLRTIPYHVVVLDIEFGDRDEGFEILSGLIRQYPFIPVVMVSKFDDRDRIIRSIKLGAVQFVHKQTMARELTLAIEKALHEGAMMKSRRNWPAGGRELSDRLVGTSPALQSLRDQVASLAATDLSVLITGETGVGKDIAAECIHDLSARKLYPFRTVICAESSEGLVTSMLFGHRRGSFTGAVSSREGMIISANQGTVFLNEIGDIKPEVQVMLLNVVDKRRVLPVGADKPIEVNVRYISATNRNMHGMLSEGTFREDLYHRLAQVEIHIPPLRERKDDIPPLVEHFARNAARRMGRAVPTIRTEVMEFLMEHAWKGNVRELSSVVDRAVQLARHDFLSVRDFFPAWDQRATQVGYEEYTRTCQKRYLLELMERYNYKVNEVRKHAGLSREHTYRLLRELGIPLEKPDPS